MNETQNEVEVDEGEQFYFESEHLALRGNKDYLNLLKSVVILEAQRTRAIEDLDKLLEIKSQAIKDPISFVAQLQNGELPELPGLQKVADIPFIDWSQYDIPLPDLKLRPQTRHANVPINTQPKQDSDNGKILVRGRAFDDSKPETFNQLWTTEEQRRLEELLIEYPPEEIEMRRWTKIANALGNRTPKQVSSRVQKYFIKLLRAGLPIPGRGPKFKVDVKKSVANRQRSNYSFLKKSTFFPHEEISLNSNEDNDEQLINEESEEDTNTLGVENTELRQIELLRKIKSEKENENYANYQNIGYKCHICHEDPLKGTRWHCKECTSNVDLCSDCVVSQIESDNPSHPWTHKLIPVRPPTQYARSYDFDYFPQSFTDSASYNYLDPNFLPE